MVSPVPREHPAREGGEEHRRRGPAGGDPEGTAVGPRYGVSGQPAVQALGERLVQRGFLTHGALEVALSQQRARGEFLGTILVREGLVQPGALLQVMSEQFGMPCESLADDRIDWRVAMQFPPSVLAGNRCFPIRADAHTVTVLSANPLDAWAISAVEKMASARRVQPVLVLESELEAVYRAYTERTIRALGNRLECHGHTHLE